jgi:hypothetical protein
VATEDLLVEVDGHTYSIVPGSWVARGSHYRPDSGAARRYATLAANTDGAILVRYVHPVNRGVVTARFEGTETETGIVPVQLFEAPSEWPISITRDPWADVNRAAGVRLGERDVLWELHGDWIREHTTYDRGGGVHA